MGLAALAGSEPGFLGLRGGIVELYIGSAGESGGTGGATVDLGCEHGVDEAGDCWVAVGYGLPPLGGGVCFVVAVEAGDSLVCGCEVGHYHGCRRGLFWLMKSCCWEEVGI